MVAAKNRDYLIFDLLYFHFCKECVNQKRTAIKDDVGPRVVRNAFLFLVRSLSDYTQLA